MPSAKRKAPATPSAAPPAGKRQQLNADKDPPLSLRRDPATKQITLSGRPAWPEVAKKIKVNRAAPGHVEAPGNLVPDRADINQAIEKVRMNLRKYADALHGHQGFRDDVAIYPPLPGNDLRLIPADVNDRVKQYKDLAKQYLATDDSSTLIKSQISDIQSQILEHLNSCVAPHQFWTFLHELEYSVTFDLSAKAKRDATEKSLKWQRKMADNHAQPAKQRYEDLLSLLD